MVGTDGRGARMARNTWVTVEFSGPDGLAIQATARHLDVLDAWVGGLDRAQSLGLEVDVPPGHETYQVVLYETANREEVIVATVGVDDENERPPRTWMGGILLGYTEPVDAETAALMAGAWMAACIEDDKDLMIFGRTTPGAETSQAFMH